MQHLREKLHKTHQIWQKQKHVKKNSPTNCAQPITPYPCYILPKTRNPIFGNPDPSLVPHLLFGLGSGLWRKSQQPRAYTTCVLCSTVSNKQAKKPFFFVRVTVFLNFRTHSTPTIMNNILCFTICCLLVATEAQLQ